jgi:uncharacterized membrane protein YeiH
MAEPTPILVIFASALLTLAYVRIRRPPRQSLLVADALGLALFTISGAQIAERMGLPAITVVLMGTITGVAGGVVRDVLTAEIPLILRRGNIYATAAIAGASIYWILERTGFTRPHAAIAGMLAIAALRLAAIWWNLQLPVFSMAEDENAS